MTRHLEWEGCLNTRDLGGLPTQDGSETRWGAVVRSDNPTCLTKAGWDDLEAYGIRTVLSLRTLGATEPEPKYNFMPSDVTLEEVFIEDMSDLDFVERCVNTGLWCTPIYFHEMLDHAPDRCAAAVSAVANAPPGGVVISCAKGSTARGFWPFSFWHSSVFRPVTSRRIG